MVRSKRDRYIRSCFRSHVYLTRLANPSCMTLRPASSFANVSFSNKDQSSRWTRHEYRIPAMNVSPAPIVLSCISQDPCRRNSEYHILKNWCIPMDVCMFLEVRSSSWFQHRGPLIAPSTAEKHPNVHSGEQRYNLKITRMSSGPLTYAFGANVAWSRRHSSGPWYPLPCQRIGLRGCIFLL